MAMTRINPEYQPKGNYAYKSDLTGDDIFRFRRTLTSSDNVDNILTSGIYEFVHSSGVAGVPDGGVNAVLLVYHLPSQNATVQTWLRISGGVANVYDRRKWGDGAWSSWAAKH
jgi:hypothetical protein